MTTFTATRAELAAALAEHIDFSPALQAEYGTFADLADAVLSHLVKHEAANPATAAAEVPGLGSARMDAMRARAAMAGAELGRVRTDYLGQRCGPVPPPEESAVVQRLLAWEASQVSV